jgi:glyoxylase-like metal-dependent hydrolase (beta-lactamase superfamily II)
VVTRVLAVPTGVANVFVVPGADGLTLVDTGAPGSLPRLRTALRRHGFALADVRRVLVTHAHVDHVGSLAALLESCDASVLAHTLDAPFVRSGSNPPFADAASLRWLDRLIGRLGGGAAAAARVDREIAHDEPLDDVAPGARAVHLGGHTPGQTGVWLPDRRFLIGGDVALHIVPGRLSLPFAAFTSDMGQAVASVRRAADLEPVGLGIGHGPPLRSGAAARLRRLAERHAGRFTPPGAPPSTSVTCSTTTRP